MTRLVLAGLLFANTLATASHPVQAEAVTTMLPDASSEDCVTQYFACSFSTDRPAAQPDCYDQFVACLVGPIG